VDREIAEMVRAIIRVGRHLPGLKRLLQVRGLGPVAAIGVLSEIGEVRRSPSARGLVAYAGLATVVRQSGESAHHGHIAKQGRQRRRCFMVEAVLSMVRNPAEHPTPLVDFYQRTKQGKCAGKAICAAARKLLTIIQVILSKGLDYWFLEEQLCQMKLKQLAAL
jgi:transposase